MQPLTTKIRQFLFSAFSDDEVTALCFDYFHEVYDNFTGSMSKAAKIQLLIEYCQGREIIPSLLAALQRTRPEQYARQFPSAAVPRLPVTRPRDPKQVFISHAHQDSAFAHRLADDLKTRGWSVWIAPDSVKPGEKWVEAIQRGLSESGIYLVALTPAALTSQWVRDETNSAIDLEHHHPGAIRLIPIHVRPCVPPPLWNNYQRVSFLDGHERGFDRLLAALEQRVPPPEPPPRSSRRRQFLIGGVVVILFGALLAALATVTGGATPSTATPSPTPTPAMTLSPILTTTGASPLRSAPSETPSPTPTMTASPTSTSTATPTPTDTPTATPTRRIVRTPSSSSGATIVPSPTPQRSEPPQPPTDIPPFIPPSPIP